MNQHVKSYKVCVRIPNKRILKTKEFSKFYLIVMRIIKQNENLQEDFKVRNEKRSQILRLNFKNLSMKR